MTVTCPECSIRYAADLPACPWCGHVAMPAPAPTSGEPSRSAGESPDTAPGGVAPPTVGAGAVTHTATRAAPPPPPPPEAKPPTRSVTYDPAAIPGPDEDWDPEDEWATDDEKLPEDGWWRSERVKRWAVTGLIGVLLLVFGGWLAEVLPIGLSSGGSSDSAATAPQVTAPPPVETTLPQVETTLPPETAPPATEAPPAIAFIEPIEPPLTDLALFELGLGEIEFGADGAQTVGRLVATLGQPTEDSGQVPAPDAEGGICAGELQRHVRWGSLSIYNRVGGDGVESFASVVVRLADAGAADPAAAVATRSGLRVGNTVPEMRAIYDGLTIDVAGDGTVATFDLLAASDGRLLLWGTATADEAQTITSMRSPLRCNA